ncbi:hypothetical protein FKM82_003213 [Ascaphus truei]
MFYSGILTESSRKEADLREAASLRQQRRMKQAVQFIHKDSADLLPLDGMKKLGTSKDTCAGKETKAMIDTSCQYNLMSSTCLDRLGLKEHFRSYKHEDENISLPYNGKSIGQIEHLSVTLGSLTVDCPAAVIDDNERHFSLGLQTLRSLKCVINLEKNHLEVGRTGREAVPFIVNRSTTNEDRSSDA